MLDFLVHIDRSDRPIYPYWVKGPMHPNLECTGPSVYDLLEVESWYSPRPIRGRVKGEAIYAHIKKTLEEYLNLQDALAIQGKGTAVFTKLFPNMTVHFWKSVAQDLGGELHVPCLFCRYGEVMLDWVRVDDDDWRSRPALRFVKWTKVIWLS